MFSCLVGWMLLLLLLQIGSALKNLPFLRFDCTFSCLMGSGILLRWKILVWQRLFLAWLVLVNMVWLFLLGYEIEASHLNIVLLEIPYGRSQNCHWRPTSSRLMLGRISASWQWIPLSQVSHVCLGWLWLFEFRHWLEVQYFLFLRPLQVSIAIFVYVLLILLFDWVVNVLYGHPKSAL